MVCFYRFLSHHHSVLLMDTIYMFGLYSLTNPDFFVEVSLSSLFQALFILLGFINLFIVACRKMKFYFIPFKDDFKLDLLSSRHFTFTLNLTQPVGLGCLALLIPLFVCPLFYFPYFTATKMLAQKMSPIL